MNKIKLIVEVDKELYDEVKGKDVHYTKSLQAIAEGKPYEESIIRDCGEENE